MKNKEVYDNEIISAKNGLSGINWNKQTVLRVWQKAIPFHGKTKETDEWRKDKYGNIIQFSHFGKRNSDFGWEIDHIKPVILLGTNHINNLQPLQWRENVSKADKRPYKKTNPPLGKTKF